MRAALLVLCSFSAGLAPAAVVHVPYKSNLTLNPGEGYTLTIDASAPTEIGWLAVQAKPCTTNCVEATNLLREIKTSFATGLGGAAKYDPVGGKISVAYKNVSTEPVTIDVFRVDRTCDAEACKFFDFEKKGHTLVFKIDEFKSIATSKDESYSVISGITTAGAPFTLKAVWWTDDKNGFRFHCAGFIKRWLDNRTPKDQYRPYILSGQQVGDHSNPVLKSIDDCVPRAPKFGVAEENVFH